MTLNLPAVTVIVPVRNGERFLAAALESVLAQHYPALDLVVVDGGSTDRSALIARSVAAVRLIEQSGKGLSNAWNCGVRAARGEFVAFLDSDDLWVPDLLAPRVRQVMAEATSLGSIGKATFFLEPGEALPAGFKRQLLDVESVAPIPGTFLARRQLFDRVGLFDEGIRIAADVDFFARAKDRQVPLAVFPDCVLRKRIHGSNLSSDAEHNNSELLSLLRRSIARQRGTDAG